MAKGSLEILKNKIDVSKVLEQLNAALSEPKFKKSCKNMPKQNINTLNS